MMTNINNKDGKGAVKKKKKNRDLPKGKNTQGEWVSH